MREPVNVLKSLSEKASNKQYKFQRLYRNLYNPEFYLLAYKNISQSQGSMTAGVDGKSLDGMSERRINALIESLKDFSYQPNPAIIVTHQLDKSLLSQYDKLLVMKSGKIVEEGTFEELLDRKQYFYSLYNVVA